MKYLLLIYENEERWANQDEKATAAEMGEYAGFSAEFGAAIKGGEALQPTSTATSVRVREGKRLTTDGPYMETKEHLGGYYVVDVADLDQAIAMAARIPGARYGGVEVRPIMTFDNQ